MELDPAAVGAAFTYAWWLTGDAVRSEVAVRRAVADVTVAEAEEGDRLAALLGAVRVQAIADRTMCAASELALLHDLHGLSLDRAAALVEIDERDARTELAHGRLEALLETVTDPFSHPERLGGLAVGNPSDVAHARQCVSCAKARALLALGRDELCGLQPVQPPAHLLGPAAAAADGLVSDRPTVPRGGRPGAPPDEAAPLDRTAPSDEAVLPDLPTDDLTPLGEPTTPAAPTTPAEMRKQVAAGAALVGLVALLAVVVLFLGGQDPQDATSEPTSAATVLPPLLTPEPTAPSPAGTPPVDATPTTPRQDAAGFTVVEVALADVADGGPAGQPVVIGPEDPVRLAVTYRGAAAGVVLVADWTVDGLPFRQLSVALASREGTHTFAQPVPSDGWPAGQHLVTLSSEGQPLADLAFTVAA